MFEQIHRIVGEISWGKEIPSCGDDVINMADMT
jgi:hypothetical protein